MSAEEGIQDKEETNGDSAVAQPELVAEKTLNENDIETNGDSPDEIKQKGSDESSSGANVSTTTDSTGRPKIELQRILYENLSKGFTELCDRNLDGSYPETSSENGGDPLPLNSCVAVNFIDTTSGVSASSNTPQKFSLLGQRSTKAVTSEATLSLNLYDKLRKTFERDYSSTLQAVAFENVRNGSAGVVEKLRVRPILANRDNAPSTLAPEGDPAEWHKGAYCHVYIAACESMEHYRGKVRPALQAFVSQIEGPTTSSLTAALPRRNSLDDSPTPTSSFSPHYVILYVPVGGSRDAAAPSASEGTGSRVGAFASRMAAARRQLQHSGSRDINDSSVHSQATNGTDGTESEVDSSDVSGGIAEAAVSNVSKLEKDIYKKFAADFPNGNTCIMSCLADGGDNDASPNPLQEIEWNTFLRQLGAAVASGFKDRCRRYDEELRKLNAQRLSANPSDSASLSSMAIGRNQFDFGHFFCVKESLAFTYEQMQLPEEALLQYEELRAFVPEVTVKSDKDKGEKLGKHRRSKSSSWRKAVNFEEQAMQYAMAGNTTEFRRQLRSSKDAAPVSHVILQYLFVRESFLLFQTGDAVEIIKRACSFIETSYVNKMKSLAALGSELTTEEAQTQRTEAELWYLSFCWHVKCSCDTYFASLKPNTNAPDAIGTMGESDDDLVTECSIDAKLEHNAINDISRPLVSREDLARCIAELLEFARLRLLHLGDVKLTKENPVRALSRSSPSDLSQKWVPWDAVDSPPESISIDVRAGQPGKPESLLEGAFETPESFEGRYVELASALAAFDRAAGRFRAASKIQGELAELFIRRKDYPKAIEILLSVVDIPSMDHWDRGHFWLLFRLACCRRIMKQPDDYLKTLTSCFGRELAPVAPPATSELLQSDLEAIVATSEVARFRGGVARFLDLEVHVEAPTTEKTPPRSLDYIRKRVIKNFCAVGQTMYVRLNFTSHLPKAIAFDEVKVYLIPLDEFESFVRGKGTVSEKDGVGLCLESPLSLEPGLNEFRVEWTPMSTGQYIVAAAHIQWKQASFQYDCAVLRKPLMEIDVIPSEPTQSVEMNPLFLMPGQVQQVRLVFHPGTDIIRSGKVYLECSRGLSVVPPGTEPAESGWVRSCAVDLPACIPQKAVVLITSVKSELPKVPRMNVDAAGEEVQTLRAKVETLYHHELFESLKGGDDVPCMKAVREATVSTLDRPALTVDSTDVVPVVDDQSLLTICLHCNTPEPLSVKEWEVKLPKMHVGDGGDMNEEVLNQAVVEGDQISLGFICKSLESSDDSDTTPELRIVLQDQFEKTFEQVLPLDLGGFYDDLRKIDKSEGLNAVTGELCCSGAEGLVGAPIDLTYTLDITALSVAGQSRRLHYRVSSNADWIVGGKVEGVLGCDDMTPSLRFVGLPTRPGVLTSFPGIVVAFDDSVGEMLPLNVHVRGPDSFKSLSFANHVALACPDVVDKT